MNKSNQSKFYQILFSLVLFSNLILINSQPHQAQCNQHDKITLLKIKKQFGNPSWAKSWNISTDCCTTWSNNIVTISCNEHGNVVWLAIVKAHDVTSKIPRPIGDLASLEGLTIDEAPRLHGSIPASAICKLVNLTSFDLRSTNLSGPIPGCLGKLKELMAIGLVDAGFTGPIPPSLTQLPKLDTIFLKSNKLSGAIPNFNSTELTFINIAFNNLTGPIPRSFGLLSRLSALDLSHNLLTGPLLPSLGQLSRLGGINLSNNRFTGSIPTSFGSFKNSSYVQLQNNQLTGRIPKTLGQLNVLSIDISGNRLIGDASFLFGKNKTEIERLRLNNNMLKFNLSNVEIPNNLFVLNLSHNKIYGSIPKEVADITTRYVGANLFDASYNHLCGQIPMGLEPFGAKAFSHNKCLCGSPLSPCT